MGGGTESPQELDAFDSICEFQADYAKLQPLPTPPHKKLFISLKIGHKENAISVVWEFSFKRLHKLHYSCKLPQPLWETSGIQSLYYAHAQQGG